MADNVKQEVYHALDQLGIQYRVANHPHVMQIGEMEELGIPLEGEVCKNLFLRDDKGKRHFLLVLKRFKTADLKEIRRQVGSSRIGFASEQRLMRFLGLRQGEVSPFGLIRDRKQEVEVLLDDELEGIGILGFHPNENDATVWIAYDDLLKFIQSNGNKVRTVSV